jgi:hypothetical protein
MDESAALVVLALVFMVTSVIGLIIRGLRTKPERNVKREKNGLCGSAYLARADEPIKAFQPVTRIQITKENRETHPYTPDPWDGLSSSNSCATHETPSTESSVVSHDSSDHGTMSDYGSGGDFGSFG